MSEAQDMEAPPNDGPSGQTRGGEEAFPANWREAVLNLISSRVALIQLESKDAARDAALRMARLVALVICIFFTWALVLAGGTAALAKATAWPWYLIAFGFAAMHLIAAIILAKSAKTQSGPAFPITRAEFQKDREWIENLQLTRKSKN